MRHHLQCSVMKGLSQSGSFLNKNIVIVASYSIFVLNECLIFMQVHGLLSLPLECQHRLHVWKKCQLLWHRGCSKEVCCLTAQSQGHSIAYQPSWQSLLVVSGTLQLSLILQIFFFFLWSDTQKISSLCGSHSLFLGTFFLSVILCINRAALI